MLACNHRENDGIRRAGCHGKFNALRTLEISVSWPAKSFSPAHKLPSSAWVVVLPRGSGSDPLALPRKPPKNIAGLLEQYVYKPAPTSAAQASASPSLGWETCSSITGTQGNMPAMHQWWQIKHNHVAHRLSLSVLIFKSDPFVQDSPGY